jgi:hypothetical protein
MVENYGVSSWEQFQLLSLEERGKIVAKLEADLEAECISTITKTVI